MSRTTHLTLSAPSPRTIHGLELDILAWVRGAPCYRLAAIWGNGQDESLGERAGYEEIRELVDLEWYLNEIQSPAAT
jgi:hypothetical protein